MLNFSLVRPLIRVWQSKLLHVSVGMTESHRLPLQYVVNNPHPVIWKLHAKFQPDCSFD